MNLPPEISLAAGGNQSRPTSQDTKIPSGRIPEEPARKQWFDVATGGNAAEWDVLPGEMGRKRHYRPGSIRPYSGYCTSPLALKVRVRGSFSFPRDPNDTPLKVTSMPPALPVLRTSVLPALIFFFFSAVNTRSITDFPSATMETHESSLAVTCTTNAFSGFTGFSGAACAGWLGDDAAVVSLACGACAAAGVGTVGTVGTLTGG